MIVLMEFILICVALAWIGTILGSFGAASVWRLRAYQLKADKKAGEKIDKKEYTQLRPLTEVSTKTDRSRCLHCGHNLAWFDLLPIISWLQLRGKCRYCHKKIGSFELLMELGVAAFFVVSFVYWPHALSSWIEIAQFLLWLIGGFGLSVLLAYDAKWFLLPNKVVFPLIGIAAASAVLTLLNSSDVVVTLYGIATSCLILSGVYYLLYVVSKGEWIGFGDIKLGLVLALLLADWRLAFLTLFLANVIGCLVVIPGMLSKKLTRKSHVPFGPMLIVAWAVAGLFGERLIDWYMQAVLQFI